MNIWMVFGVIRLKSKTPPQINEKLKKNGDGNIETKVFRFVIFSISSNDKVQLI